MLETRISNLAETNFAEIENKFCKRSPESDAVKSQSYFLPLVFGLLAVRNTAPRFSHRFSEYIMSYSLASQLTKVLSLNWQINWTFNMPFHFQFLLGNGRPVNPIFVTLFLSLFASKQFPLSETVLCGNIMLIGQTFCKSLGNSIYSGWEGFLLSPRYGYNDSHTFTLHP